MPDFAFEARPELGSGDERGGVWGVHWGGEGHVDCSGHLWVWEVGREVRLRGIV